MRSEPCGVGARTETILALTMSLSFCVFSVLLVVSFWLPVFVALNLPGLPDTQRMHRTTKYFTHVCRSTDEGAYENSTLVSLHLGVIRR